MLVTDIVTVLEQDYLLEACQMIHALGTVSIGEGALDPLVSLDE